jgi:hypothetical protein
MHWSALVAGFLFLTLGVAVCATAFTNRAPLLQLIGGLVMVASAVPFFLTWKNLRVVVGPSGVHATNWLGTVTFRACWDELTMLEEAGFPPRAKFWRLYAGDKRLEFHQGKQPAEEIVEVIQGWVPALLYRVE